MNYGKTFMNEKILCSAIWFNNDEPYVHQPKNIKTGLVICGLRHCNCYQTIYILSNNESKYKLQFKKITEGFLTNLNRFVDREEAYIIALNAKQIDSRINGSALYSEDLY